MNTAFFIARRYIFAKKSTHAINIISAISAVGVMIGSAALIVILSVFNGFEDLVLKSLNSMSPQLMVLPSSGKTFNPNDAKIQAIKADKRLFTFTEVLAENALVRYDEKQTPAMVKGVSKEVLKNHQLDSTLIEGKFVLENKFGQAQAVLGGTLQGFLGVNTADPFVQLQIFTPKKGANGNSINPLDDFSMLTIPPAGVFEVHPDYDNLLLVPLSFARELLSEPVNLSSIEINLQPKTDVNTFKQEIIQSLGRNFVVKDRVEQNQALYNVLSSEKWIVYIILTFILVIAIFNIVGSLTMLVIDKQKDISVLISLGANKKLIKQIFLIEGMLITVSGCIFGIVIGLLFCLLQQHFGWIKMGEANFLVSNSYPIQLKWLDFVLVFVTVSLISFIATLMSSGLSVRKINQLNENL
jgi:lipoprotein-releasing system permease protein